MVQLIGQLAYVAPGVGDGTVSTVNMEGSG